MSAAEKLEALKDEISENAVGYDVLILRDALPEIIAVVRRAERLTEWVIGDHVAFPDARELRGALSALDEALPQIGSTPPPEGATSP